ncbi:hypothetical protein HNP36_003860 [Chryseobacterium shigense]|uniref:Uncharacterized protein n=1 Tax=Chryseobacterium shigense TaxID=297244 RepID=A0A841NL00_9FLAO|nr:hypothetical protein [Chryseobacterium shigense]
MKKNILNFVKYCPKDGEYYSISKKFESEFGSDFKGISILFLEGIFNLNKGDIPYKELNLIETDFFIKNYPRTVELELERMNHLSSFFERCVIYDGGSRTFEPSLYLKNLTNYWMNLYELSSSIDIDNFLQNRTDLFNEATLQNNDYLYSQIF